jgi:FixJ family two-component response regulator
VVTTLNSHCVVGIVEDDRAVRDALCNLLASVGLDVAAFGSAEELIASTRSTKLNCLILDVALPGMSGPELQRAPVGGRQEHCSGNLPNREL